MQTSEAGIDLIKKYEGRRLRAYPDPGTHNMPWTIGYGHTGPDVHPNSVINVEQAEWLLRDDVKRFEEGVRQYVGDCTQGQFDALVSFSFNLGLKALRGSTLLKKHLAHDYEGAAEEFKRWHYSGQHSMPGLIARRAAEAEMYRGND